MSKAFGLKLLLLGLLSCWLSVSALSARTPQDDEAFFVRLLFDREKVVAGDSCLLSVVAYATRPFEMTKVSDVDAPRRVRLRALPIGQQPLQRVSEGQCIYFAQVLQQYVLTACEAGTVKFHQRTYKATLHIEEPSNDPFDAFFGRPGRVVKLDKSAKNAPLELEVLEKPKRTMLEMHRSGLQVL